MKKNLLITICFISLISFKESSGQQCEWLEGFNTVHSSVVEVDKTGNNFTLIPYKNSINEITSFYSHTEDSLHFILIKRDKNNIFLWSKIIYCTGLAWFNICFNENNEAVLNGNFSGSLITPDFTLSSAGGMDICIIKIDGSGTFSIIKQLGGAGDEYGECAFDSRGFMIVTGGYKYSGTFDTLVYPGALSRYFFLLQFNTFGNLQWSQRAIPQDTSIYGHCVGSKIKTDSLNNIYVEISGIGNLESNGLLVGEYYGAHLHKFTSSGAYIRGYGIGSAGPYSWQVGCNIDNNGNIYYAGGGNGNHNSVCSGITKKDSLNNIIWTHVYGAGGYATPDYFIRTIYMDRRNNLYFMGSSDTIAGIPEFVSKADAQTGNTVWSYHDNIRGNYLITDSENSIYVSGNFVGTKTVGTYSITSLDNLYGSPYIAKLSALIPTTQSQIPNPNSEISLTPNPSSGIFTIHSNTQHLTSNLRICVYDLLGNCVFEKTGIKNEEEKIDLSAQAKGIYFVKTYFDKLSMTETGEGMFNQKIVVE